MEWHCRSQGLFPPLKKRERGGGRAEEEAGERDLTRHMEKKRESVDRERWRRGAGARGLLLFLFFFFTLKKYS